MVRAVRPAPAGILLVTLSACSAGRVTQTATQAPNRTGGFGQVGDLTVRQVQLAHPPGGVYRPDDQAELRSAVVDRGTVGDQLTSITGPDFSGVVVAVSPSTSSVPSGTSRPTPEPPTSLDSPGATTDLPASAVSTVDVPIPAGEVVLIGSNGGPTVLLTRLTGLTRDVDAAQSLEVVLTFARAGALSVTAIMSSPPGALLRGPAHRSQLHGLPVDPGRRQGRWPATDQPWRRRTPR